MLLILSGLPGVGKTTLARKLASVTGAVHIRIDSIEHALRNEGVAVEGQGYAVAYAIADDNLRTGHTVIADCVNPWTLTRRKWRAVANRCGVPALDIEVVCSDTHEHRHRVESRTSDLIGHQLPTWQEVLGRDYAPWEEGDRVVVDTARLNVLECIRVIRVAIVTRRLGGR